MTRYAKWCGLWLSAVFSFTLNILAQTNAPAPKKSDFPLSESASPQKQAEFDKVIAEARATDVDATVPKALLYHGLGLFQEEKYAESIPFMEEGLRLDPSLLPGWESLGWAYMRTGDQEKSERLWKYFQQLMPDEWMPYNLLAQLAIMKQDWVLADQHFKKALAIKPDQFDLRFWYAQNLLRLGQNAEAEKIFRQLIKQEPERLDIQINLASLLAYSLKYDEAVDIWRRVNKELPGNAGFMMDQAVLELRVGELKAADQLCLDVLAIEPDNLRAMALRVDIAEIGDMTEMSVERLKKLVDATKDPQARGLVRVRMANRCSVLNERHPGLFEASFILGQIRQAIDENPADVDTQVLYAEKCLQEKQFVECKKWAVHVLERFNRHNIRAKITLFELALAERRFDDADQILNDRFVNYDPTDPMRYYYEARLLAARGDFNEALKAVDRMEAAAQKGTVLTLLYHDLTESDWMSVTSVRRLREHVNSLKREGFTFISPADIPSVVGLAPGARREDPAPEEPAVPWTAVMIDNIRFGITGDRRFKSGKVSKKEAARPVKVVAITFDGAQRSAFLLGSSVAEEVGVPFGMFAITKPFEQYTPSVAGWSEIGEYAANGSWVIGSQLYGTPFKKAVDKEGKDLRRSLPNRIWQADKNRLESMNEWDARMRFDFRESRKILRARLGDSDGKAAMVAYPFGDIGQESLCNLSLLRNPTQSILSEADRNYQIGFVQGQSGYTTYGDDLLLCRRFEPNWFDEGADVVRHAYEYHPLFMARRQRVEIAFLMSNPHVAEEMLSLLKRDGYPDELCRKITNEVRSNFRNRPMRDVQPLVSSSAVEVDSVVGGGQTAQTYDAQTMHVVSDGNTKLDPFAREAKKGKESDVGEYQREGVYQEGSVDPWVNLSHPYVNGEVSQSQAIDQFKILRYGGRGGLYLNRNTQLSVETFDSRIQQDIRPRWNAVEYDPDTYQSYMFKAVKEEARARLTYRTPSGAVFSGSLGLAELDLGYHADDTAIENFEDKVGTGVFSMPDDSSSPVGDLAANWSPRDNLNLYVFYAHDLVTSAIKKLDSDSVGAVARWKPTDAWHVTARSQYWSYEDNNSLFYLQGESFWEKDPELGIWLGLDVSTISSANPSDYYWTPYWDERAMGVLRYLQSWQGYTFRLDLEAGFQREDARPMRTANDVGLSNGSDWQPAWGVSSTYSKRLSNYLDVFADGSVMALNAYIDHRFLIGFNLGF